MYGRSYCLKKISFTGERFNKHFSCQHLKSVKHTLQKFRICDFEKEEKYFNILKEFYGYLNILLDNMSLLKNWVFTLYNVYYKQCRDLLIILCISERTLPSKIASLFPYSFNYITFKLQAGNDL